MSIEDVVLIATVRDEIRTSRQKVPLFDTARIRRLIEAAQVRMVAHVASDDFTPDITPAISENEAAEEEPPKGTLTSKVNNYGNEKAVDMHGGDEHSVSACV